MSETEPEEQPDEAGEPGPRNERAAKVILAAVGLMALWGIVAAMPEVAYVVVGILGCRGWQKARGWLARRGKEDSGDDEAARPGVEELVEALHQVADPHVHLVPLAERLGTDTVRVKQLLAEAGVPVAAGVRMRGRGVSPGVRAGDIPPLPSPTLDEQGGDVAAGQASNNNSNNVTVERIAEGVAVVRHSAETAARRHTITH